jgi:hypothetical protein
MAPGGQGRAYTGTACMNPFAMVNIKIIIKKERQIALIAHGLGIIWECRMTKIQWIY